MGQFPCEFMPVLQCCSEASEHRETTGCVVLQDLSLLAKSFQYSYSHRYL